MSIEDEGGSDESWLDGSCVNFCPFLGMLIKGVKEDIARLLPRMKERRGGKG